MHPKPTGAGSRVILAGVIILFLLVPLAGRSMSLALLLGGSFLLTAAVRFTRHDRLHVSGPAWLRPDLPLLLMISMTTLLLFRSHRPEEVAGRILLAVAAYLLYRILLDRIDLDRREPILLLIFLAPLTYPALAMLTGWPRADWTASAGDSGWLLLALPIALRGALRSRSRSGTIGFACLFLLGATLLGLSPIPIGWTVLVIAALVPFLYLQRPAGGEIRTLFLISAGILLFFGGTFFNARALDLLFSDHLPFERLYHWEQIAELIHAHPLGTGPGNLPDALAVDFTPSADLGPAWNSWPNPQASDLLRAKAENGWGFFLLLVWGLGLFWAMAGTAVRAAGSLRERMADGALFAGVIAGTAIFYLYNPLSDPGAIAGLCLVGALTTAHYRKLSGNVRTGAVPVAVSHRIAAAAAVAAAILVIFVSVRDVISSRHFDRGVVQFESGDLEAAERSARAALRILPGNLPARGLLAEALRLQGDCRTASAEFLRIRKREPKNALNSLRLLECFDQLGYLRDGLELAEELVRDWPEDLRILTESAGWLARDGKPGMAEKRYLHALEIDPSYRPAKFRLAELLQDLDRNEEAVYYYRGVARDNPTDPEALIRLGDIRYSMGRYPQAANYFALAINLVDGDPELILRTSAAFFMIGHACEALGLIEEAIDLGLPEARREVLQTFLEETRKGCEKEKGSSAPGEFPIEQPTDKEQDSPGRR